MKSYTLHFIRHGLTEANLSGQYAGVWDVPVCDEGKEKLKTLKLKFEYPKVLECYSSPLTRCLQTSKIIYPELEAKVIEDLKEWNFGKWEGKTPAQLLKDEEHISWVKSGRKSSVPGGESGEEFGKRVCSALEGIIDSIVRRKIDSTAIFTHGGVIMSLLTTYGIPRAELLDWACDNGCGYSVRIMPSLWMRDKVFEVYEKIPNGASGNIKGKFKDLIDSLDNH